MDISVIRETKYITGLPINEKMLIYENDDTPCCIGARLAGHYKTDNHFLSGIREFASRLGGNTAHVILMFQQSGAGKNPLGKELWGTSASDVWDNMLNIKELPSLINADLSDLDLSSVDFRGYDLKGTNFKGSNLFYTNFQNSNLTNANFSDVAFTYTNFQNANLTNTILPAYVKFKWAADLTDADLTDAIFLKSTSINRTSAQYK